jgi:hypothetical protein
VRLRRDFAEKSQSLAITEGCCKNQIIGFIALGVFFITLIGTICWLLAAACTSDGISALHSDNMTVTIAEGGSTFSLAGIDAAVSSQI